MNKLIYEYVKNYIENNSQSGCKLLSNQYINNSTKLDIQCKCGNTFKRTFKNFKNGQIQCKNCSNIGLFRKNQKSNDEFFREIFNLVNDEYVFLDNYINARTKLNVVHNKCGYVYFVSPHDFLQGSRCPECSGNMKKNTNKFKKEVFDLVKDEYTILGEYINSKTKILIRHNHEDCLNFEFYMSPDGFLRGARCPKCQTQKVKLSKTKNHENFRQEMYDLVGYEYVII